MAPDKEYTKTHSGIETSNIQVKEYKISEKKFKDKVLQFEKFKKHVRAQLELNQQQQETSDFLHPTRDSNK